MNWQAFTEAINSLCEKQQGQIHIALKEQNAFFSHAATVPTTAHHIMKLPLVMHTMKQIELNKQQLTDTLPLANITKGSGVIAHLHDLAELSLHDLMKLSIIVADNTAANTLLDQTDRNELDTFLTAAHVSNTRLLKPFMSQNRMRDNFTSAIDCMTLLQLIGEPNPFFNEESRRHLYGMLYDQQLSSPLMLSNKEERHFAHLSSSYYSITATTGILSSGQRRLYISIFADVQDQSAFWKPFSELLEMYFD